MNIETATLIVNALGLYATVGLLFALCFVFWGVGRVDPAARGGTWGFRLLVLPGVAALWPLLLLRWLRGSGPPEERNAHRLAAQAIAEHGREADARRESA